jgi:hypothetical protein
MISQIRHGRSQQQLDGAGALFLSAISRMVIMGIRKSAMVPAKPSSGRITMIVHAHGLLLAHHLGAEAELHHVARGGVESESEDQREQRHHGVADRAKRNIL